MAESWIKMRTNLWTDPRIVRIVSALETDKLRVVGALYRLWSLADEHSVDGTLPGYTPTVLDVELGLDGFADAAEAVGWLTVSPEGVSVPNFADHNGAPAKRRAKDSTRKGSVRKVSASDADESRNR